MVGLFQKKSRAASSSDGASSTFRHDTLDQSPEAVAKRRWRWQHMVLKMCRCIKHQADINGMILILGAKTYYRCFQTPTRFLPKDQSQSSKTKKGPVHQDPSLPKVLWDPTTNSWSTLGEQLDRSRGTWPDLPEECEHPEMKWKPGGNSAAKKGSLKGIWWICRQSGSRYVRLPSQADRLTDMDLMCYGRYTKETYSDVLLNHPECVEWCLDAREKHRDVCGMMKRFLKYVDAKRADMEDRDNFSDEWSEVTHDEDL